MKNKKGFTLVELMIVVVILSVLATVGFISYENYLVDTRDSKRLAQLTGLRDGLRLATTRGKLPLPDDAVEIRNSGTTFLYQGYAGEDVLESISYSESTIDPLDDTYYTYLLSNNRRDFQLMGFLEKYNPDVLSSVIPKTLAGVDYSQRYPNTAGKKLGIVLQQDTNTPLQEINEYAISGFIDLQDATTNNFDAYITDTYLISGKENDLIGIIPFTTCKKILETGGSYGNGIYNINPSGLSPIEVYCNMELDGGGWTLVGRSHIGGVGDNFGWIHQGGNLRDNDNSYSLGDESRLLGFSEIMLTTYSSGKNIDLALKVKVDRNFIKDPGNDGLTSTTGDCIKVFPSTNTWTSPCDSLGENAKDTDLNFSKYWGGVTYSDGRLRTDGFMFAAYSAGIDIVGETMGLSNVGYIRYHTAGGTQNSAGDFSGQQGMIFVR